MKIIALYSIKGGVGKTAACVNLAYLAAERRRPTLLCDLDPQGSSSFYFRIQPKAKHNSRKLLKGGKRVEKAIRATDFQGLDLLPADLSYRHLDIQLNGFSHPEDRLQRLLAPLKKEYAVIFLDCPPNITLVSENVFAAADVILVPIIPTTLSLLTFRKLEGFFAEEGLDRSKLHPFLSMVEPRKRMHRETVREMRASGIDPLRSVIPYSAEVERMGFHRAPLNHYRPDAAGAKAFVRLWREVCSRILKETTDGH